MAKFKPYKITKAQLEQLPIVEGQLILTIDDNRLYFDESSTKRILINDESIIDFTIDGNYIKYTRADGFEGSVYIDPVKLNATGREISISSTAPTDLIDGGVWFIIEN